MTPEVVAAGAVGVAQRLSRAGGLLGTAIDTAVEAGLQGEAADVTELRQGLRDRIQRSQARTSSLAILRHNPNYS